MKKSFRKAVVMVCLFTMIVTCITSTPVKVDAGQSLSTDVWTKVGAWELYSGNSSWCAWATMEYTSTGNNLGDTTVTLTNSPNGDWNDVEYGLQAKLTNYISNAKDTGGLKLQEGSGYLCNVTIKTTESGTLITQIENKEYRTPISGSNNIQTVSIAVIYHVSDINGDMVFCYGMFPKNTEITIESVEFVNLNQNVEHTTFEPESQTAETSIKENTTETITTEKPTPEFSTEHFEETTEAPTEAPTEDWNTVPNADPTFTEGPWNMFGNLDTDFEGNWGVVQYKANKENPETYADYDIKAASVSGWLAWSSFVRLENYLADYYDPGDPYDITLTLKSSKATKKNTEHPEALDQLLVVIGADLHYFDLQEGVNTLHITGDNYNLNSSEPHEQIMLELDGLQAGTELTLQNIQITGPNDGWTNIPNKKDTKVGDWTFFGWWDATHWSKLAHKNNSTGTGLGATDIKVRRNSGSFGAMTALAMLPDYLETAKDTKNRPIANDDDYQIKVTMNVSGLDSSVTDYGQVRLLANGQAFDFDIQKGTKKYDLLDICGKKMTYDSTQTRYVMFELDEVSPKAVLNIQKIEFVGPEDDTQEYTTDITTEAPIEVTTEAPIEVTTEAPIEVTTEAPITEESTAEPTTAPEPTTNPEIDSLREQVNQLSETLNQHIEDYNTQISILEAQLAQLQGELEDSDEALSGRIDSLNTQLTDIRNQIVDINSAMETLENDVANNSTSIVGLQSDMESVLEDLATVDSRIEDAKTEVENTVKAYVDDQVEALSGEINIINNSINGLSALIGAVPEGTNIQSEIVDIQNSVQAIEGELDGVDLDQIDKNKQQISTLQTQLLSITNTIAQNLLTETQNRIDDTNRLTNTIDTINNSLKTKDAELQTQIDTLSSQLQTANADIQSINEQIVEIQSDIATNATNIGKNTSDIQSLVEQLSAAVAELNTVENRIQTAKGDTLTLAQTYTDQKIAELNSEFENRMKEQGDDFTNKYNEQKEEIDRLNKEILGLKMSSGSTSVRLSYASKSLVNLSWNKHPYASGYEVYVMKPGKSAYELVADVKSQAFSYSIAMNLSYKFMVKAYMNDEKSTSKVYGLDSNAVSANAITPGRVVLKKVKAGKKKCTVLWNAVPKAVGYQIFYKQKKAKTITVKANQLSQVIKKLKKKKKVTVKVRAFVTYGVNTLYGAWSNTKKVKIK